MEDVKSNIYDKLLIAIIVVEVFGNLYGPIYPPRMLSILLSPIIIHNLLYKHIDIPNNVKYFFIIWIIWGIASLLWSCDQITGMKYIIYHFCNIITFFSIYVYSIKARRPIKSIIIGWTILFAITMPIALYELNTNVHLPNVFADELLLTDVYGLKIERRFAAVTFGNLNTYNVMLCYCMVFISLGLFYMKKIWSQLILWTLLVVLSYIIMINASRGAFICMAITYVFLIYYLQKQQIVSKRFTVSIIIIIICIVFLNYENIIGQFETKVSAGNLIEDSSREEIWITGIHSLAYTVGLGVGIGGTNKAMLATNPTVTPVMHNAYLEFIVEFGIIVGILFIIMIYSTFIGLRKSRETHIKYLGTILVIMSFPLYIINSGYVGSPSFWLFLGCTFTILQINRKKIKSI